MIRSNHCAGRSSRLRRSGPRSSRTGRWGLLLSLAAWTWGAAAAGEPPRPLPVEASAGVEAAVFQPRAELTLQELAAAVRERAAALQEEHLAVELGAAELRQSRLSLPLALYDHGQAMARAARARQHRTEEQRRLTLAAAAARLTGRGQARLVGQQRLVARQQQVLPRVQAILRNVGRAFEARAVPLTDVMRAQRGLGELLREVVSSGGPGEPIGAAPRPAGPSPIRRWKRGR